LPFERAPKRRCRASYLMALFDARFKYRGF